VFAKHRISKMPGMIDGVLVIIRHVKVQITNAQAVIQK